MLSDKSTEKIIRTAIEVHCILGTRCNDAAQTANELDILVEASFGERVFLGEPGVLGG